MVTMAAAKVCIITGKHLFPFKISFLETVDHTTLKNIGASSGIGAGAAIHFAKLGYKLSICGRNESGLKATLKQCLEVNLKLPNNDVTSTNKTLSYAN